MTRAAVQSMLVAVALLAVAAIAAQKIPQIGYLEGGPRSAHTSRMEAFRQGLRELGYEEGKNIVVEWRFGDGKVDIKAPSLSSGNVSRVSPSLSALATELVGLKVAVIVTGGTGPTRAAKEATSTIPIVMAQGNDPVVSGVVASLARPGGNITGLSNFAPELSSKRLEILKEVSQSSPASPCSGRRPAQATH